MLEKVGGFWFLLMLMFIVSFVGSIIYLLLNLKTSPRKKWTYWTMGMAAFIVLFGLSLFLDAKVYSIYFNKIHAKWQHFHLNCSQFKTVVTSDPWNFLAKQQLVKNYVRAKSFPIHIEKPLACDALD